METLVVMADTIVLVLSTDPGRVLKLTEVIEELLGEKAVCFSGEKVIARHDPTVWVRPSYSLVVVDYEYLGPDRQFKMATVDMVAAIMDVSIIIVTSVLEPDGEGTVVSFGLGGPFPDKMANSPWRYVCREVELPKVMGEFHVYLELAIREVRAQAEAYASRRFAAIFSQASEIRQ